MMPRTFNWTDELLGLVKARFPIEGASKSLVRDVGVGRETLRNKAQSLGLSSSIQDSRLANLDQLRSTFFHSWTPESAYYLGYVFADGCVAEHYTRYALRLCCQRRDREILVKFKETIRSNHLLKDYIAFDKRRKRQYLATRLIVTNDSLARCLVEKHGILPGKSVRDLPFPVVPVELLHHFCRGVLDGDGCITRSGKKGNVVSWNGSHRFIRELRSRICLILGLRKNILQRSLSAPTISRISWSAAEDIQVLSRWLYPIGIYPFLPRKRIRLEAAIHDAISS